MYIIPGYTIIVHRVELSTYYKGMTGLLIKVALNKCHCDACMDACDRATQDAKAEKSSDEENSGLMKQ